MERTLEHNERGYKNLKMASAMLEAMSATNAVYTVEDTYLDYGQDWKWTTIVRNGEVQILNPREWREIVTATSIEEVAEAVEAVRADKYFGD